MPDELRIVRDPSKLQTTYANMMAVTTTDEEVILDFGMRRIGDANTADVLQRIVTSPAHAERIAKVMLANLEKHRRKQQEKAEEVEE